MFVCLVLGRPPKMNNTQLEYDAAMRGANRQLNRPGRFVTDVFLFVCIDDDDGVACMLRGARHRLTLQRIKRYGLLARLVGLSWSSPLLEKEPKLLGCQFINIDVIY